MLHNSFNVFNLREKCSYPSYMFKSESDMFIYALDLLIYIM